MNKKIILVIILGFFLLIFLGLYLYYFSRVDNNRHGVIPSNSWENKDIEKNIKASDSKKCSEETRICPNKSIVGRSGENCEFMQCPKSKDEIGQSLSPREFPLPEGQRGTGAMFNLNFSGDEITLIGKPKRVDGFPNRFLSDYEYMARDIDSNGNTLGEYGFDDPRRGEAFPDGGHPEGFYLEEANMPLIVPYFFSQTKKSKELEIYHGNKLMLIINISAEQFF